MPEEFKNPEREPNNTNSIPTGWIPGLISENQWQVSIVLGTWNSNQLTSEEIVTFSVKGKSFTIDDYVRNILVPLSEKKSWLIAAFNAIPVNLRGNHLATLLIDNGFIKLAAFQISTFSWLNHRHAVAYIKAGFDTATKNHIKSFAKDERAVVMKLLSPSQEETFEQAIASSWANHTEIALEWIRRGDIKSVISCFSKLDIQDYDQFAKDIVVLPWRWTSILEELIQFFPSLSIDTAKYILGTSHWPDFVVKNVTKFVSLDLLQIRDYLIEIKNYSSLFYYKKFFGMTFSEVTILAIQTKDYYAVLNLLGRGDNDNEAYLVTSLEKVLIEENRWDVLLQYSGLFEKISDNKIHTNFIQYFGIEEFALRINQAKNIHARIAQSLIQAGHTNVVVDYINNFSWLNANVCDSLIKEGYASELFEAIEEQEAIFYSLSEQVAVHLLEDGSFFDMSDKFYDLSSDFASRIFSYYGSNFDSALESFAKRIDCFHPFDISFLEYAYKYAENNNSKTRLFDFLKEHFTHFATEAQDYIIILFMQEDGTKRLSKIACSEETKKMAKVFFENFPSGGAPSLISSFKKIYLEGDLEKLQNFVTENRKRMSEILKTGSEWLEFQNLPISTTDIARSIYPKRDYSPKDINIYVDQSEHLRQYTFNPEGYTFTLSNLLGYKLKEGVQMDTVLLENFKTRVQNITNISKDKASLNIALDSLAQVHEILLESTGFESRILEFLLKKQERSWGITKEDFDILIAYQLMGRFEQFIKNSNDKLATSTDPETMHMVQILALLQEYGDPLKESVRKLEKLALQKDANGANTSDTTFLLNQFGRSTPKEVTDLNKDRIISSMVGSFSKRPEHTITDSIIRKSILEKCKAVLQKTDITEEEQEVFAKSFTTTDFIGLQDPIKQEVFESKWKRQVEENFGSTDVLGLNLRSITKTQQSIYSALQQETQKFEEIVDKNGLQSERHVFARFGKTKYDAFARGVGDICLGLDEKMWTNPNYFELVLFDADRLKCIGTVMLLNMPEPDGKRYLLYGPNPSVEFDDKVSSFKLFDQLSRIVTEFAQENDFDGVVFDPEHGRSTNRSWDFQTALEKSQLKENDGKIKKIDLKKDHLLWGNYEYREDLSFLWKKS